MRDGLKRICYSAKEAFRPIGLDIRGLHYFIPENFQRKRRGILVCFDAFTNNPYFFGKKNYQNWRRIKLMDMAYRHYDAVMAMLPGAQVTMDVHVRLREPFIWSPPAFGESTQVENDLVDVSADNGVKFVELDELISGGEVEPGSTLDFYCRKYGISHVLRHGLHCISPDSASVEALEAIADAVPLHSVLEVGAGVGVCGAAASRRGIKDFTFFDQNRGVCDFLRKRFPDFRVNCGDALKLDFYRDWRAIFVGLPYELMPWFLAEKGKRLQEADLVVFQSGSPAFFEFEHNWIVGSEMSGWPWWHPRQTLSKYFPFQIQMSWDWQNIAIGCRQLRDFVAIKESMVRRGFSDESIKYENIQI